MPSGKKNVVTDYTLPVPTEECYEHVDPTTKAKTQIPLISANLLQMVGGWPAELKAAAVIGLRKAFGFNKPEQKVTESIWKTAFETYVKVLEAGKCKTQGDETAVKQISEAMFEIEIAINAAFAELVKEALESAGDSADEWTAWVTVASAILAPADDQVANDPTSEAGSTTQVTVIDGNAITAQLKNQQLVLRKYAELVKKMDAAAVAANEARSVLGEIAGVLADGIDISVAALEAKNAPKEEVEVGL